MPTRSPVPRLAALALALLPALACQQESTAPRPSRPNHPLGLVEVTISGIGTAQMRATAAAPAPALGRAASVEGLSLSLSPPANGGGGGNGSIQLSPLATGSFTVGARTGRGIGDRYMWATFSVRNAQSDGTPYDTPRKNLTFFAVSSSGTLGGSAITSMEHFDGSAADPALATQIRPTGSVYQQNGLLLPNQPDVLQIITESEAAAIGAPAGVGVLPYGFVVRNGFTGDRTLAANPSIFTYEGLVTFAFRVPLQSTPAADPFTISALFLAVDDSETRITQALEEQTPAGEAAFLARAREIGATMKTVLPGMGSYWGDAATTRTACSVRTAGPSASPTAYLVQRAVASVTLTDPYPGVPLWAGGSVARHLGITARNGSGTPLPEVPVHVSFNKAGVLTAWGRGGVRMLPRRDRTNATVSASACGSTSATALVLTSGFSTLAGGYHSLALKGDGTVVGWGDNFYDQTTVPTGLANVVQVAAGRFHSVALRSNGTVAAWGLNNAGQASVPSGLTNVVQVVSGGGADRSFALKDDGTVVGWGYNGFGEATMPNGLTNVVQIATGANHSLALRSDGTVVAWGWNNRGQTTVPQELTDVVQIAAGGDHSLALKRDGTVVAWGHNGWSQATVPNGLTNVVQIAAGVSHSLALRSDGTVVAWGRSDLGQVTVPNGLANVAQISAGSEHSLAVKSNGTVVAWGYNNYDQTTVPSGLVAAVP